MNIQRCKNELVLSNKFKDDLLSCNSLAPGIAKESKGLLSNKDYSFMCSTGIKKDIERIFGQSNSFVEGKEGNAAFFAFTFKNETIICTSEGRGVGTQWYWVNSQKEGSRYGNYTLLSCDKEVKEFWPEFCKDLKEVMQNNTVINSKPRVK